MNKQIRRVTTQLLFTVENVYNKLLPSFPSLISGLQLSKGFQSAS